MTAVQIHDPASPGRLEDFKSFLARVNSPAGFQEQQQLAAAYDAACTALIGPNDVQIEGERSFKKKSAWRKLGRHFSISTVVVSSKIDYATSRDPEEDGLVMVATVVVRAIAVWGQSSEAIGASASDEESGQRVITIADALATAETRATNRAISNLIAMGEVSAEEIQRPDGSARQNGPPVRKQRPAGETKMPFGPSKNTLLKDMETKDLEGALRWAEDRSDEKGSIQFGDFQKAAKEELERRRNEAAPAASAPATGTAPAPAGSDTPAELDVDAAHKYPFPFKKGTPNYQKPIGSMSSEHLLSVRNWIVETQREQGDEEWHSRTLRAIDIVLEHRQRDQTKLEFPGSDGAGASKTDTAPASASQEAKTAPAAPSGGPNPAKPGKGGKVNDAIDPDPTSSLSYHRRIREALKSPNIPPELRSKYTQDNVNGFKGPGRQSLEWWVRRFEDLAGADPESFPGALEETDDDLPF